MAESIPSGQRRGRHDVLPVEQERRHLTHQSSQWPGRRAQPHAATEGGRQGAGKVGLARSLWRGGIHGAREVLLFQCETHHADGVVTVQPGRRLPPIAEPGAEAQARWKHLLRAPGGGYVA